MARIKFEPMNYQLDVEPQITILEAEQLAGIVQDAPCGGHGKCKKCRVRVGGQEVLACGTKVDHDMTVTILEYSNQVRILTNCDRILTEIQPVQPGKVLAAIDIGTTTIVCYLLDEKTGKCLEMSSMLNPQYVYGTDVVSRIQYALKGKHLQLTNLLQNGVAELLEDVCGKTQISYKDIGVISIVGNPCMQQLFLGLLTDNLAEPPFVPKIIHTQIERAEKYLPLHLNAALLVLPNIAGYVGSDTLGCVLSVKMYEADEYALLIDIGTNGEMVLGNCHRMLACSAAAGPALEGVGISMGMRGSKGAIDHVWTEDGALRYSAIENAEPIGICGSGIIDAVAAFLKNGWINRRGNIQRGFEQMDGQRRIPLSGKVYLTQNDIRAVQTAKGAIAAGIELMVNRMGIALEKIEKVYLAGAFGNFIRPESACRIGLIPEVLLPRIIAVGNAAGAGSRLAACSQKEFLKTDQILDRIEALELSSIPEFQKVFAKNMYLKEQGGANRIENSHHCMWDAGK